jgi:glycosyltransferase involved in cell wall biosynthesis
MEHVIVATYATRDYLIDMGLRPSRLQVVRRGVDVGQFSPKRRSTKLWPGYGLNGSTKLLYVGRVSKEKNIDDLITVFHALRRTGSEVELAIVGDGPYREELEARELGSEGLVFTGFLEGEELAKAYASSDLFVFPSTTDTFGNAVLEAQASGLPAIVTDMGGPSELIEHNRTGLVVPAGDRAAMATAIRYLLDNTAERKRMSTAARRNAEGCTYRSAAKALWSAYSLSHAAAN